MSEQLKPNPFDHHLTTPMEGSVRDVKNHFGTTAVHGTFMDTGESYLKVGAVNEATSVNERLESIACRFEPVREKPVETVHSEFLNSSLNQRGL